MANWIAARSQSSTPKLATGLFSAPAAREVGNPTIPDNCGPTMHAFCEVWLRNGAGVEIRDNGQGISVFQDSLRQRAVRLVHKKEG